MAWYDIFNSGDDAPVTRTVRDVQEATAGARGPTGSLDPGNTIPDVLKQYGYDDPEVSNAAGYAQRMAELKRAQLKKDYTLPKPQGMELLGNMLTGAGDMVGQVQNPPHVAAMLHGNNRILQYLDRKKEYEDKLVGANKEVTDGLYGNIDKTVGSVVSNQMALAQERAKLRNRLKMEQIVDEHERAAAATASIPAADPTKAVEVDAARRNLGMGGGPPDVTPPNGGTSGFAGVQGAAGGPSGPAAEHTATPAASVPTPAQDEADLQQSSVPPEARDVLRDNPSARAQLEAAGVYLPEGPAEGSAPAAFGVPNEPMKLGGPKPQDAPPAQAAPQTDFDNVMIQGKPLSRWMSYLRNGIITEQQFEAMGGKKAAEMAMHAAEARRMGIPEGTLEFDEMVTSGQAPKSGRDNDRLAKARTQYDALKQQLDRIRDVRNDEVNAFSSSAIIPNVLKKVGGWWDNPTAVATRNYESGIKILAGGLAKDLGGARGPTKYEQQIINDAISSVDLPHETRAKYLKYAEKEVQDKIAQLDRSMTAMRKGGLHYKDGRDEAAEPERFAEPSPQQIGIMRQNIDSPEHQYIFRKHFGPDAIDKYVTKGDPNGEAAPPPERKERVALPPPKGAPEGGSWAPSKDGVERYYVKGKDGKTVMYNKD